MNRAFILIFIPAALVAVGHSAMRWGMRVALPLGLMLAVIVGAAYFQMGRRQKPGPRSETGSGASH